MIEDIKLKDLLNLIDVLKNKNEQNINFWKINKIYFIRTVTMHLIGKLKSVSDKELLLDSAIWVADSGRFHDALKSGELNEIEPFIDEVIVNRDCIVDATIWNHLIPNFQK
jgi:hypothetical protein